MATIKIKIKSNPYEQKIEYFDYDDEGAGWEKIQQSIRTVN